MQDQSKTASAVDPVIDEPRSVAHLPPLDTEDTLGVS